MASGTVRVGAGRLWVPVLTAGFVAALTLGAAADPVTITFDARPGATTGKWASWETLYKDLIAKFEASHPNIKVQYLSDWDQTKIPVEMAAGSAPDIFEGWGAFAYGWAQNGDLLDLSPFVKRDYSAADIANFYPPQWNAGIIGYGKYAGQRYGVPHYTNASVLYYNQSMFENYGLPLPPAEDAAGRWNYAEFMQFAKKLTIKSPNGQTTQYGMTQPWGDGRFATWIWGEGGQVFNLPDHPDQYVMDQPKALAGLQYIADLYQAGVWGGSFTGGTTAMEIDGSQGIGTGYENVIKDAFKWNIGPMPKGPSGSRGTWVASDMWLVNKATKHPDAAWEFVKYLVSTPAVWEMEELTGQGPMTHTGYQRYADVFPNIDTKWHVDAAEHARIQFVGFIPYSDKIVPLISAAANQVASLQESPKAAATEAGTQIKGMYQLLEQGASAETRKPVAVQWDGADWESQGINQLVLGSATPSGSQIVIKGAGADIWGAQDAFQYLYQKVSGDFTATVVLHSVENINAWSKAGIMVRASNDSSAAHASIEGTPGNGIHLQYRDKQADSSSDPGASQAWADKAPVHFKLVRKGDTVTTFESPDGKAWTQVGTAAKIDLGSGPVLVGLAVTAHTYGVLAGGTFSDWTLTQS